MGGKDKNFEVLMLRSRDIKQTKCYERGIRFIGTGSLDHAPAAPGWLGGDIISHLGSSLDRYLSD